MSKKKQPEPNLKGVHVREDGTRHLLPDDTTKHRLLAAHEDHKSTLAERHQEKLARVETQRELRRRRGRPPDKSPI